MLRINSKKVSEQKAGCQGVQRGNEHSDAQKFGLKESEEIRRNRLEQESVQSLFYSSQFLIPTPWSGHRIHIVDTTDRLRLSRSISNPFLNISPVFWIKAFHWVSKFKTQKWSVIESQEAFLTSKRKSFSLRRVLQTCWEPAKDFFPK